MKFTIKGQVRGGKNHMIVLRNGMHIPLPAWKKWRDKVVAELKENKFTMKEGILTIIVEYYAQDKRKRDVPGMTDAIFHCLERAGIVKDDSMFKNLVWITKTQDKLNPRVEVQIL